MARFVLVHGGLHGSWSWERITPLLEAAGHVVSTVDLPGSRREIAGADVTLESYRDAVVQALEQGDEPTILVGHSIGGKSISVAAEARPELVRTLVYVAAMLPHPNPSPEPVPRERVMAFGFTPTPDGSSVVLSAPAARTSFFSDCSDEDAAAAFAQLVPQPLAPMMAAVKVTEEKWGRIPRHYVMTESDRTITIEMQEAMLAAAPGTMTHRLASGHAPFYTHSRELAAILKGIASARTASVA